METGHGLHGARRRGLGHLSCGRPGPRPGAAGAAGVRPPDLQELLRGRAAQLGKTDRHPLGPGDRRPPGRWRPRPALFRGGHARRPGVGPDPGGAQGHPGGGGRPPDRAADRCHRGPGRWTGACSARTGAHAAGAAGEGRPPGGRRGLPPGGAGRTLHPGGRGRAVHQGLDGPGPQRHSQGPAAAAGGSSLEPGHGRPWRAHAALGLRVAPGTRIPGPASPVWSQGASTPACLANP